MAEEKAAEGTMLCVSFSELKPDMDDLSAIKLEQLPIPKVGDDSVLVAVKGSSVNPFDAKLAHTQSMVDMLGLSFPVIVGMDVSGVVEQVGKNVESVKVGDKIWAFLGTGGWAEKCAIAAEKCMPKPEAMSWDAAGVLGCASFSGMNVILGCAFKAGDNVLVRGATGGIGTMVMQFLHHMGASGITAVCSGKNAALAQEYGATEVIDYTKGDPAAQLAAGGVRFDCFCDCAPDGTGAPEFYKQVPQFLKKGAKSSFIGEFGMDARSMPDYPATTVYGSSTPEATDALKDLFSTKPIKVAIGESFALKDWEQGMRLSMSHRARGKISIKIAE